MTNPTRMRAMLKNGSTEVRARMSHVMESGQRKAAVGGLVPAHYITEVKVFHNDKVVLSAQYGPSVSANPYLAFRFQGGDKGDRIRLTWTDNLGESRSDEVDVA